MNENTVKTITMYTTNWCGDCFRAKSFLRSKNIGFQEVNIEHDEEAARTVMANNGGKRRVPTFEIDGQYYGNPPIDQLAAILGVPIW